MGKYMNFSDLLIIGVSAYVVVWGVNSLLRTVQLPAFQA